MRTPAAMKRSMPRRSTCQAAMASAGPAGLDLAARSQPAPQDEGPLQPLREPALVITESEYLKIETGASLTDAGALVQG